MKIYIFILGWNLKHKTLLKILVYTFLSISFYIICVRWIQICRVTFYINFGDRHLQISKTQNGHQNVKKTPYFLLFAGCRH